MSRVTMRVGYWNMFGPYNEHDKGGFSRVAGQAATIRAQRLDLFVGLELHEETYTAHDGRKRKAYAPLMDKLAGASISEGRGGNQLIILNPAYRVLRKRSIVLPGPRGSSKWNVLHEPSGVRFWVGATHFIAGGSAARHAVRAAEVAPALAFMAAIQRGIWAYDGNSYSTVKGAMAYLMDAAGWRDMRTKSKTPVIGANRSSHHGTDNKGDNKGHWIENLRTRRGVRVDAGALVPTGDLSDHDMLVGVFTVDSEKLIG